MCTHDELVQCRITEPERGCGTGGGHRVPGGCVLPTGVQGDGAVGRERRRRKRRVRRVIKAAIRIVICPDTLTFVGSDDVSNYILQSI